MRARLVAALGAELLVGVRAAAAQHMSTRDLLALPKPAPDTVIRYGTDSLQFGELRVAKRRAPVAVVIHGGCWVSAFGIDHQRSEAEALREAGLSVWSIEYRRVGNPGGGWPGTFQDVGAAIDHLRELARHYPLDLGRVVLVGHSAGGHLALWAAGRRKLPLGNPVRGTDPLPVAGVVSLAGVGDLKAALDTKPPTCGDGVTRLVGESTPDRLRMISPVELLPLGIPQEIISGADDAIVPPAWANDYGRRAKAAGDRVTVTIIPNAGHFEVVSPGSPAWKTVQAAVLKLANP